MNLDPRRMQDWQIADAAEDRAKPIRRIASEMGLRDDELIPYGAKLAKVDYATVLDRLNDSPRAKYVDVTAITPTPLGEGKTTTTLGLIQGLGVLGKRVCGAIRQPSSAPTFNIKGSAAGGGLAQCIPLTPISIRFTGDIDCVTNAHNLAMVALTARMQHERNYDDARLTQSGLRRLDVDPNRIQIGWAMDFCAQSLRNIRIGRGAKMDGFEMDSGFQMTVASEVMAILSVAADLRDLRERIAHMVVAYDKQGHEVTTRDLEVDGAMTAWLIDAINPNLVQTLEGQPVFIHAGPFANIAHGNSSIIADMVALKLADYVVTESGFGADMGMEKFFDIKCRYSGNIPNAVVLVATVRALKMHGGGPKVTAGAPLAAEYTNENLDLVRAGADNLLAHCRIAAKFGIPVVVAINRFPTDTDAELELVRQIAVKEEGVVDAVVCDHYSRGGAGAVELGKAVMKAANLPSKFDFLYPLEASIKEKIETIAREVYGADGVDYSEQAEARVREYTRLGYDKLPICMAKTHLSLSHDPALKGVPKGFRIPIRDISASVGAGFLYPLLGTMSTMPGLPTRPAYYDIDIDFESGRILGLS